MLWFRVIAFCGLSLSFGAFALDSLGIAPDPAEVCKHSKPEPIFADIAGAYEGEVNGLHGYYKDEGKNGYWIVICGDGALFYGNPKAVGKFGGGAYMDAGRIFWQNRGWVSRTSYFDSYGLKRSYETWLYYDFDRTKKTVEITYDAPHGWAMTEGLVGTYSHNYAWMDRQPSKRFKSKSLYFKVE